MNDGKVIVSVNCTANFDRSPTITDVAKYHIQQENLTDRIEVYGGGTKAGKIRTLTSPMRIQRKVIILGFENKAYSPDDANRIRAILSEDADSENAAAIRIAYAQALQIIRGSGGMFRGYALGEQGIPMSPEIFQLTHAREGLNIALGMKASNVEDLASLLSDVKGVHITTFQEYVGTSERVPDPMGKGLEAYREMVAYSMKWAPRMIERALDESHG